VSFHYGYDERNRLVAYSGPEGARSYVYDELGQLLETRDGANQALETYDYDANGNRQGTEYELGLQNRLKSDGTYDYEYDAEGNRTKRTLIATGESEVYAWDGRNRLASVTFKDGVGAVVSSVGYSYDVANHRVSKRLYDASGTLVDEERYVYDGDTLLLVLDGAGAVKTRQVVVGGMAVAQQRAGEELEWLVTDRLGSTRQLVAADGTVVASYNHDAYGNLAAGSGDPTLTFSGWTGLVFDAETGNYYAWNRYYDPQSGEWLSDDPIGFAAGTANLGEYVGNGPTNGVDPTGLEGFDLEAFQTQYPSLLLGGESSTRYVAKRNGYVLPLTREQILSNAITRICDEVYERAVNRQLHQPQAWIADRRSLNEIQRANRLYTHQKAFSSDFATRNTAELHSYRWGIYLRHGLLNPYYVTPREDIQQAAGAMAIMPGSGVPAAIGNTVTYAVNGEVEQAAQSSLYFVLPWLQSRFAPSNLRGASAGERLAGAAADSRRVWSSAAGDVVIDGSSLPGRTGMVVHRRLTTLEMEGLQRSHGVEFALIYELGAGRGGGGGRYLLYSGEHARVWFPPNGNNIWISHTHPEGYALRASTDDQLWLQLMQRNGSPQKTSTVIPLDGDPFRFNVNQKRIGGN
jgi:RHS repeat-associated protein